MSCVSSPSPSLSQSGSMSALIRLSTGALGIRGPHLSVPEPWEPVFLLCAGRRGEKAPGYRGAAAIDPDEISGLDRKAGIEGVDGRGIGHGLGLAGARTGAGSAGSSDYTQHHRLGARNVSDLDPPPDNHAIARSRHLPAGECSLDKGEVSSAGGGVEVRACARSLPIVVAACAWPANTPSNSPLNSAIRMNFRMPAPYLGGPPTRRTLIGVRCEVK